MNELKMPGRVIQPRNPWGGGHYWLNAAIVEAWGKTLLISRVGRVPAMLCVHELDADLNPVLTRHLFGCSSSNIIAEDPRAVYNPATDRVEIWYVGIHRDTYPSCRIYRAEMDQNYRIHNRQQLIYDALGPFEAVRAALGDIIQEKNWMPFKGQDGEWLCIYNHEPFTVLRVSSQASCSLHHTGPRVGWEYGGIRGGAAPLRHEGLWWHFFHSSQYEGPPDPKWPAKVYYVGCYVFDDDLCVRAITREPILAGRLDQCTCPWDPQGKISACFPCGAILRKDTFLVSYGWLDAEVRLAEIPIAALKERMTPFATPSPIGDSAGKELRCKHELVV